MAQCLHKAKDALGNQMKKNVFRPTLSFLTLVHQSNTGTKLKTVCKYRAGMTQMSMKLLERNYLHSIGVGRVRGTGSGVVHSISCIAAGLVGCESKQRPVALLKPQWIPLGSGEVILTF